MPRKLAASNAPAPLAGRGHQTSLEEIADTKRALPSYDKAPGTRNMCIAGLVFSWVTSIACIALAPWTFRANQTFLAQSGGYTVDSAGEHTLFLGPTGQEAVKLAVNICISICTDCLGYIHATSLRWSLLREGRLHFNTNLRLLASTRGCSANRWSTNFVAAFLLTTCYASSSQLFLTSKVAQQHNFVLNGIAIAALGVGILGQAAVATLCLLNASKLIPTWSSNPLNTALVLLQDGRIRPQKDCCMLSADAIIGGVSGPAHPAPEQPPLRKIVPAASRIVRFLWSLFALYIVWSIIIYSISRVRANTLLPGGLSFYGTGVPALQVDLTALLLVIVLQACLTLGLHATELLVNASRDESLWRRASTRHGIQISYGVMGSIKTTLASWEFIVLSVMKPVFHWLFGLSLYMNDGLIMMNWQGILPLSGAMLLLTVFATVVARRRPRGVQPAAFGHLQTLVNLIDTWPETAGQTIWWGDKGEATVGVVGHAGTSINRLETVQQGRLYAGR